MPLTTRRDGTAEGRSPFFHAQRALGATFADRAGWAQPFDYGDSVAEHRMIREAVGLVDTHSLGKLRIEGADALTAVQRLYTADMDVPIGRGVFSCLCNEEGGSIDDGIVWRVAEDAWLATCTTYGRQEHLSWARKCIRDWKLNAAVTDVTSGLAYLQLAGPRAREALLRICDDDVSCAGLRPQHMKPARIAGVEGFIGRAGFSGELSFELYVDAQYGEWVWDKALDAVRACGGGPAGFNALFTCALEKGYTFQGLDYGLFLSPLEGGIGFTVAFDKPHDFNGKQALLELKERGFRRRVMGFVLEDKWSSVERGAAILVGGEQAGIVMWCEPALSLDLMIGRAVFRPEVRANVPIEIKTETGTVRATTHSRYFYDRDNARSAA